MIIVSSLTWLSSFFIIIVNFTTESDQSGNEFIYTTTVKLQTYLHIRHPESYENLNCGDK